VDKGLDRVVIGKVNACYADIPGGGTACGSDGLGYGVLYVSRVGLAFYSDVNIPRIALGPLGSFASDKDAKKYEEKAKTT
jgi:hypothetical protein